MSGVILLLSPKVPDAEEERFLPQTGFVGPLTHVHSHCGFISTVSSLESSYKGCLTPIGKPHKHKLHAIEALGTSQLAVEVANAIPCVSLNISRWVVEIFQALECEPAEVCQPPHFCRQCQNIWVEAEIKCMESRERANAEGNGAKHVVAEV